MNKKVIDKLPTILSIIGSWGCAKAANQSFEDYLRTQNVSNKKMSIIGISDRDKLKKSTFQGLDFTFMCQLLSLVCGGITLYKVKDWEQKDDSHVEYYLNQLRELRNAVMHEPEGTAVDLTLITKVEKLTQKLLEVAGKKFSKGTSEVNLAKTKVKDLISDIKSTVLTEKERASLQYQKLIVKDGIPEMR